MLSGRVLKIRGIRGRFVSMVRSTPRSMSRSVRKATTLARRVRMLRTMSVAVNRGKINISIRRAMLWTRRQ